MSPPRVLVVDDEAAVRDTLKIHLDRRKWRVTLTESPEQALQAMEHQEHDLVITDVRMPKRTGLDLLRDLRDRWPHTPVVVMTGFGSVEDAVDAIKAGAAEYLVKPVSRDALFLALDRALEQRSLRAELLRLRRDVQRRFGFDQLVGASGVMQDLYAKIEAVADATATVLLQGPTGTGKELLAHALHYTSSRASRPFVRVNCTALPESLLESELFGHEQGAFTGAIKQHRGRFEQAAGGTLFLDEIGDMNLSMQARLLRVLETGDFQRVGGTEALTADVRVVAATHRDLRAEVREGRFREDLFYRLDVVRIQVPPLSDRQEDIPALVEHFVQKLSGERGHPPPRLDPANLQQLQAHSWPGNVRQLEHAVERSLLLHSGPGPLHIPVPEEEAALAPRPSSPPGSPTHAAPALEHTLKETLDAVEREHILAALQQADGVQAEAARQLGVSRSNLHYRMKRLGISRDVQHG